jgi:hypothetical protein
MVEYVTPKPMPVTSMPDRVDPRDQRDMELKAGIRGGKLIVNPGKPPSGK